jgi:hypothetical protein
MSVKGHSLDKIVEYSNRVRKIYKSDLNQGDFLIIQTLNSIYTILVQEKGYYLVSGGWFAEHGISPSRIKITGCSWGASIININILAACGLCLEFENRLVTSQIKNIGLFKSEFYN